MARGIVVVVVELVDDEEEDDEEEGVVVELLFDAGAVVISGVGGAVATLLTNGDVVLGVGETVDDGDGVVLATVVVGA